MLRALLLPLLVLASVAWGQAGDSVVSAAQVDAAVADVTANRAADDPQRAKLLRLYGDTRAALQAAAQYKEAQAGYAQARAGAAKEAAAIEAGLAEREVAGTLPGKVSLAVLEQKMQVSKAELEARKSRLSDIRDAIDGMPDRAARIRDRLTELGALMPKLQSRLAMMPKTVEAGSEAEANLWLAGAQSASATAEKAALDEELLSQPMRLQLLAAQQDRASQDIAGLDRYLQAMDRQASALRQTEATKAHVEAEKVLAGTQGKHALVQQLADKNAELTASFSQRGGAIEQARQQEVASGDRADRLADDLKSIEYKLSILGMSTAVGQILREQEIQLPKSRESKKQIAAVSRQMTDSSVHQLELVDERRKLLDAGQYVDQLVTGLDQQTAALIRPDLLDLARKRRDLVKQAVDLENTYASALGNLQFNLRRYASTINDYRQFISERLLWIPSRDPFSLFHTNALPTQLIHAFTPERWLEVIRQLPTSLALQPWLGFALVVVMVLAYRGPRLKARVLATGREVGYVRTDRLENTMLALAFSLLLSLKWPLLMWTVGQLCEPQELEFDLAMALHTALSRGAVYFWGLEFLRMVLMPKGLVASHFRWPAQRVTLVRERVVRLEQTFMPAAILVVFALVLYPREVGGPLGALAVIFVLLSLANFFYKMPQFMQSKVTMLLSDGRSAGGSRLGRILRQLLVWVPLLATIAVLFGYIYTAMEFSLLLVRTLGLSCLVILANELGMRWLRMARRRMVARARAEAAQAASDEGEASLEEELLENDPELLNDQGTKLLNVLTLFGVLAGIFVIWSEVFPAFGILDSVELWQQTGMVEGQEASVPVTLGNLVSALVIAVIGWVALRRIPSLLEILLRQKMGVRAASAYAATRVFLYAATAALVIGILSSLGGSWSQIQWAVAALSVGIGFGLQEIVANFISGLIILFEQPIRVGDTVTVGDVSGKVTKIRIRATTIRDFDRRELLVPNKEFITQQLLNWSLSDQVTRQAIEVGVAYGTDLDRAIAIVREAAKGHPLILKDPEPIVTFEQFGDNSLLVRVRFFMDQLDARLVTSSELMLDINRRLNEAGIVVAFPQRDVHLDTSEPLEIRMVAGEAQGRPEQPSGQ